MRQNTMTVEYVAKTSRGKDIACQAGRREKEEETRDKTPFQGHSPIVLLPSARPHLLKFVELLKIAPTARSQAFNT
jgi:hypothetical protein